MEKISYKKTNLSLDTVVFIHGWAGNKIVWDEVGPSINGNWRTMSLDLWGHGKSREPFESLTEEDVKNDLIPLLGKVGIRDFYLVCHSMGCAIGLLIAKNIPERVKGMVLIEGLYPLQEMFASRGKSLDYESRRDIFRNMLYPKDSEKWAENLLNELLEVDESILTHFGFFLNIDRVELLSKMAIPFYIVSREKFKGKRIPLSAWNQIGIPSHHVKYAVDCETHFLVQEDPEQLTQIIQDCLRGLKKEKGVEYVEASQVFFDKQSAKYYESSMHAKERLTKLIKVLNPKKSDRVLDVGCGAGHTTYAISPFVKEVVALDNSLPMLEIVSFQKEERGLTNVSVLRSKADNINLPSESFEKITCRIAAHHFPDLDLFLKEAARLLVPGGAILVVDNSAPDDQELHYFSDTLEKIKDSSHFRLYTEANWRLAFSSSGIQIEYLDYYQSRHDFGKWANVADMDLDAKRKATNWLMKANSRIENHFCIEKDHRLRSVSGFGIDRILIKGIKQ